jgi:hypothetical protein
MFIYNIILYNIYVCTNKRIYEDGTFALWTVSISAIKDVLA